MIKTLVYTSEFIQNLSKYRNSHTIEPPQQISEPLETPEIKEIQPDKSKISSEQELEIKFEPYERKFKDFNENIYLKGSDMKKLPQINYSKVERTFYLKGDLSEKIEDVKRRINDQAIVREKILELENNNFNSLKAKEQNLANLVKSQDLRKNGLISCESEKQELIKCKLTDQNCEDFEFRFKECLQRFN